MAISNWINQLIFRWTPSGVEEPQAESYNLGTTFHHVYYQTNSDFSLRDAFTQLKDFFSRPAFMIYSSEQPTDNSSVVEWYEIKNWGSTGLTNDTKANFGWPEWYETNKK